MAGNGTLGAVTRDEITWAYRLLLAREPENEAVIGDHLKHGSRQDLLYNFLMSVEFSRANAFLLNDMRLYSGYSIDDLRIFERFNTRSVRPEPGFVTDWIGSRTRTSSLWSTCAPLDGTVGPIPVPSDHHAEAIEWIGTLKAILAAKGSFSVMELGAGCGPWLAASCAAARAAGIRDVHVCGVEADPGRFRLLVQNMADNNLTDHVTSLRQAAIGVESGHARWPRIADPSNDAGARPLRHGNADDAAYLDQEGDRSDFIDVEILALAPLLAQRPIWDLLHIDIQGTEAELCEGCLDALRERVRYMVIGTHSREIDARLMSVLHDAGWRLEHEKPTRMTYDPDLPLSRMTTTDGAQVWRNPAF